MARTNNTENEINLLTMFYAGLHKWRLMLTCAVAFAVLAGAFGGYKANGETQDEYANREEMISIRNKKLESSRAIEDAELSNSVISQKIAEQQEYLDKSIWINMDSYDIHCATAEYFIDTDYQIMPGMDYQNRDYTDTVASTYRSRLMNADILNVVAERCGTEYRYLNELLSVSVSDRILTISVINKDDELAQAILEDIVSYLPVIGKDITESIAEHTITLIDESAYSYVDLELVDKQGEQSVLLQTLMQTKEDNDNIIADAEYDLYELEKEEQELVAEPSIMAKAIKYAIIGTVLGMVLAFMYGCFRYILGGKVYIADELGTRYGLHIIGTIASGKNRSLIDARIAKAEGRTYRIASDSDYRAIAGNLMGMKEIPDSIFITGVVDAETIEKTAQKIIPMLKGIAVKYGADIINNPDSIDNLSECNGVVFIEECGKSRYADVDKQLEKAEWFGKKIIGCIVIE